MGKGSAKVYTYIFLPLEKLYCKSKFLRRNVMYVCGRRDLCEGSWFDSGID